MSKKEEKAMNLEKRVTVFDIGHFRNTDGYGIRTIIFFKGCPLRCQWCSNPFGLSPARQLAVNKERCVGCGRCVQACPNGVNRVEDGKVVVQFERCTLCGKCLLKCPVSTRMISGKDYSVKELFDIVYKDAAFYRRSRGGVTLSGGEVLMQSEAAASLLVLCKKHYLDTCIETSAYAPWEELHEVAQFCDLIFVDIKHIDSARHRELTGVPNELILDNIRKLCDFMAEQGRKVILRRPLIPGYNDEDECTIGIARFVSELAGQPELNILPYHNLGESKYAMIGRKYTVKDLGMLSNHDSAIIHVRDLSRRYAPHNRVSVGGDAIEEPEN